MRVAVNHVSENAGRRKGHGHVCEAEAEDGTGPVSLIVDCGAETEEADSAQDGGENNQGQAEFGLVDTAVLVGEVDADPVVHGARNDFTDQGEDERGETDETGLGDRKIVGGFDENDAVGDRKDNCTQVNFSHLKGTDRLDLPIQVRVVP